MDWTTIQGNYFLLLIFVAALGIVGFFIGTTLGHAWNRVRFQAFLKTKHHHYGNSRWQGHKVTLAHPKKAKISVHKFSEFRTSMQNTNLGIHAV